MDKEKLKQAIEKLESASKFCGDIGGDICETIDDLIQAALKNLKEV